jgi:membrane protease subunit (stomatin/prohibitin family)
MNLSFFKNQLASVIEWPNPQLWVLLYKFPSVNDEIKNASQLIIGPGQGVMLVYEGVITDILTDEGIYTLETDNHPFITTLLKLRTAFESEHKLKIYFYRVADNTNQNWGTANAIKYVDPVYNFPVKLGANGSFSYRITDPKLFFAETAGLSDSYITTQAQPLMLSRITQTLATQLATAQFSYQQIDAQLGLLSDRLKEVLTVEFKHVGLLLNDFRINGTVFDNGTQDRINSIADVTAETEAAKTGGLNYVDMEKLKALRDAAKNQGGMSGAAMQIGAGLALSKIFNGQEEVPSGTETDDPMLQLHKLKQLLNEKIITQEEFDSKKKDWLDKL